MEMSAAVRSEHSAYRTLLAVDIESYGRPERSDPARVQLRRHLTEWCTGLLREVGADSQAGIIQAATDGSRAQSALDIQREDALHQRCCVGTGISVCASAS